MAKAKAKELTLRQQMRQSSESELEKILDHASNALVDSVREHSNDALDHGDIAKLLSGGQTKTLRDKLVGQLAKAAEKDLVLLWNNQQKLDLESKDAD